MQKALVSGINRLAQEGGTNFGLHPLIHTPPSKNVAPNVVDNSKWRKCRLKYVIHSQVNRSGLQLNTLTLNNVIMQI